MDDEGVFTIGRIFSDPKPDLKRASGTRSEANIYPLRFPFYLIPSRSNKKKISPHELIIRYDSSSIE